MSNDNNCTEQYTKPRVIIGRMNGIAPYRVGRAIGGYPCEVRAILKENHPDAMWAVVDDNGGWLLVEV